MTQRSHLVSGKGYMAPFIRTLIRANSTRNIGWWDRILRALLTPLVGYLIYAGILSGWFAVLLGIIALMLLPTSLTGACSIYYALGWSTCPISSQPRPPA